MTPLFFVYRVTLSRHHDNWTVHFKPLKVNFKKEARHWTFKPKDRKIARFQDGTFTGQDLMKAASVEKGSAEFRVTGIHI
jgi:hypothetical protein